MLANNEVGTIQPIAEIAARVRDPAQGILFAVDAVQAAPHVEIDVEALGADLARRSAPTSSRARRASARCTSATARTSSSSSRAAPRSATVAAGPRTSQVLSGWRGAYELACAERPETVARLRRLRERLRKAVLAVEGTELTGHPTERLPDLLSLIVRDADGSAISVALDLEGIAASVGSACTTGSTEVSPRPHGDGLSRRGGARGAAPVARPLDDRCRDRDGVAIVPRVIASLADRPGRRRRGPARDQGVGA